ncbi:MAG: MarR family transcriptional regulator [Euryarchaeota archaeon]|nr:MarR family transcriptional regulator [Euryarchaeota archaeon]MDE1837236.1 MarR family transcriptional regulator [Euryarchaeota archaeon]MDE1879847.1 MarR family transcriptional regulator [Euryarchaeota archaeon]MDE2045160.1 MarR family transcriptional regulator [Thermoplasmata archaeon]
MPNSEITPEDREALLRNLRLCYWRTLNRLDETMAGIDLTARQFLFLKALEEDGPSNARKLCEVLFVTPADVTGLSSRLERKGYVRRVRSVEDRRRVILEITGPGRKALEQARRLRDRLVDSLISSMPFHDFRQMIDGLGTILRTLSAEPTGRSRGEPHVSAARAGSAAGAA